MKYRILFLLQFFTTLLFSQSPSLIPKPVSMKAGKGFFLLNNETTLVHDDVTRSAASYFNDYLKTCFGISLTTTTQAYPEKNVIVLKYTGNGKNRGQYELKSEAGKITISGDAEGIFYGMQTLIQLLPAEKPKDMKSALRIPQVYVFDYPRFEYRGMHLDCGRHFWPVSFIKKYIDYLALHKFNKFHWHLTEDQGWRIEIKKYPELTRIGARRNGTIIGRYPGSGNDNTPYGGFYTQEEIRDIVLYAQERFIEVIPEIEMPGHSSAAIASYPWLSCFPDKPTSIPEKMISAQSRQQQQAGRIKLVQETWGIFDDVLCAGNDSVFQFLQDVIDEVISLFPSTYFHIGGDECPKTHWKQCGRCQQRIKTLNLKDEHELQSYFVQRIEKYLNSKGKILIGWDEILEGGLAPNAVVMSWRGETGGIEAAKQKHYVIMTPGNPVYFDHSQTLQEDSVTIGGYNPLEKVYAYDPVPQALTPEEAKYVLGAQANVWTEYMNNTRKVEYMVFPRIAAISEVLWTQKENKNFDDFRKRLQTQLQRYRLWNINYSKAYLDVKAEILPEQNNKLSVRLTSSNPCSGCLLKASMNSGDGKIKKVQRITVRPPYRFTLSETSEITARLITTSDSGYEYRQTFHFHKATAKKITLQHQPSSQYAGNGAFTLVDGIRNQNGRFRSGEFLGFSGEDCIATIDFGKAERFSAIKVHSLHLPVSWIHHPDTVRVYISHNGKDFDEVKPDIYETAERTIICKSAAVLHARFVRIHIQNIGKIPEGFPGQNSRAWLFVDEIEVN
ncbi:MAG: beta-N-acetylhexosaminidase [Chitinophagaceae bacterium]|nr:beta-N-acetylhexosaminidase [Chitinophagaceae bacterium]